MAKILLVEDDNNLREIYEARLLAEGYDIVSARDGEEALTVAMKELPDLIISDVMMPKISGFDMLDIIRTTEETKNTKVIMMTALSQAEDKERANKLGADRYLVKSQVTLEDVAKVAREVLQGVPDPAESLQQTAAAAPVAPEPAPAPTPAPAPEPVTTAVDTPVTPAPVAAVAPEPVVTAPAPVAVAPEPASTPAPVTTSDDAATPSVDPLAAVQPVVADDTTAMSQTIEEEQSAIAAQIESFIEGSTPQEAPVAPETPVEPSVPAPAPAPEPQPAPAAEPVAVPEEPQPAPTEESPAPAPAAEEPDQVITATPPSESKRVIQPLSAESDTPKPSLEELARLEEEKEAAQAATQMPESDEVATPPKPAPQTSGTNIDGVVPPPSSTSTSTVDPNAIAL